jgi:glutathione S-transferase
MALTLYTDGFYISPYAFSAFVALEEKKLPFQIVPLQLADKEHQRAEFQERSQLGRVPALDHDGFWLAESGAIVEYLEERFAPPLHARVLPADIQERARARMVMQWIRSDLMALREERPTSTMFYPPTDKPLSRDGEAAAARLKEVAMRLVPAGATSLFSQWSIADSDLAFKLQRLLLNGHEVPARLRAFVEAQWARPSVQKWVKLERAPYRPY